MAHAFATAQQADDIESVGHGSAVSSPSTAVSDTCKSDAARMNGEKKTPEVVVNEVEDDEEMPDVAIPSEILPEAPILQGNHSFLNFWWQEFIACSAMILSIIGISITLAVHQGQPLPKWPLKLTLNTVISILVVILKATMLAILTSGTSALIQSIDIS